jgi:dTDP-4-amino-4,6-dideoxygalactose transaminase
MGDIGCFSFFPSKNLGGFGDGGMVLTNDDALAEKLIILRVHGAKPKYYHKIIGGNFRLDTIQAAVVNVKLDYLDKWTKKRQENAALYRKLFLKSGLTEKIVALPEAVYEGSKAEHHHIYNQFCIRAPDRNRLRDHLQKEGIGCEIYYPVPFHLQECFRDLGYGKNDFPVSQTAALESLALPIYPELTSDQIQRVVQSVGNFNRS